VPDEQALVALADELGQQIPGVIATSYAHGKARLTVEPDRTAETLLALRERGFRFLASVHGLDYYPQEPRLSVQYELLDMDALDRITVTTRVTVDAPNVASVTPDWPTANHQEREVYDMFGIVFDGHPDLRRILMPDDYEGHPQRRDFPIGGEPVIFTHNENDVPGWIK